MKRSGHRRRWDETMAAVVIVLLLAGLVLLHSTSAYNGRVKFHDEWYYLKKQGFATLIGLLGMVFVAKIDYHRWAVLAVPGYLAAVALSVAVMLFGDEYNGSKRWLSLGPFSFQPSEFAKVAVIIFLAWLISRHAGRLDRFRRLLLTLVPVLPIAGLTELLFGRVTAEELKTRDEVILTEHLAGELEKITKLTGVCFNEVV